jgi:seryl-tRNA synthetase
MRHFFILALALLPAAAQAQTATDSSLSDNRFEIERQGDSIIRLDTKTGAISTCTESGSTLDCKMSADERAALEAEIDRLATEVEALKTRTASAQAPSTGLSDDGKELTLKLPTEAEVKEALTFLENMFNRAVSAVRDLVNGNA